MAQGKDYYLGRMTQVNTETTKRGDSSVQTLCRDRVCMCSAFTIMQLPWIDRENTEGNTLHQIP